MTTLEKYQRLQSQIEANGKVIDTLMNQVNGFMLKNNELLIQMGQLFVDDAKKRNDHTKQN